MSEELSRAKPRVKSVNRDQLLLRPTNIEELVPADHEVRAIWELTGRLDLSAYYESIEAVEGTAGREAFDPRLLVSLWVYAIKDGVSSAREIERLCEYHPAYQWLTGMQPVNHHTLSDFRVRHQAALDRLFTDMLGVLSAEGLVTLERVMHDGTKIKSMASDDSRRQEDRLKTHLAMAQEQVAAMGDPRNAPEVSSRVAAAQARAARENKERLEQALVELKKIQETKEGKPADVSPTDPEARIMKHTDGGYALSYNVQISTDAKAGVIVGMGMSQAATDYGELELAVERLAKTIGKPQQVVVDGGYMSRTTILEMDRQGVDLIGSLRDMKEARLQRSPDSSFGPERFVYDAQSNRYRCPMGKVLTLNETRERPGRIEFRYRARAKDCLPCSFKAECCPDNAARGRGIVRIEDHPVVTAFRQKMKQEDAQAVYHQRSGVAEFPNAWIKEKFGLRRFRYRGMAKAGMEALWACLTYNIQLWIRMKWKPQWQAIALPV